MRTVFTKNIQDRLDDFDFQEDVPDWNAEGTTDPQEMVLITQGLKELREIMSYYVGIVRSNVRLKRAMDRLYLLYSRDGRPVQNQQNLAPINGTPQSDHYCVPHYALGGTSPREPGATLYY